MRTASAADGKFHLSVENIKVRSVEHIEADYLLIASGNSRQVGMDNLFFFIFISMVKCLKCFCWIVFVTGL